ncbi:MAG: TrkA family potassium uptake protein [Lachnospiraceae bacterium]|nr:TrkA family potassium uptake protein [Lachnospiraceae bacterium]
MFEKKKGDKTTYAVIGLGRFGEALATALAQSGAELLVMDKDEEKVRELREYTENAFQVHTLDKKTLEEAGVQNCDVAIVCIGEHLDTSILTTLNLVEMGVETVISKANSVDHGKILEKLGAQVVYPEHDMALRLASRLETARVLDFIQLSEKINISKLHIPDSAVGKTVQEVDLRSKFHLNIIALENRGNVMEVIRPDYVFKKEDVLFVSGSREGIRRLSRWMEK